MFSESFDTNLAIWFVFSEPIKNIVLIIAQAGAGAYLKDNQ
jgi:hypothetical protein